MWVLQMNTSVTLTSLRIAFPSFVITIPPVGSSNICPKQYKMCHVIGLVYKYELFHTCYDLLDILSMKEQTHLHHSPWAQAGPDHICNGLK